MATINFGAQKTLESGNFSQAVPAERLLAITYELASRLAQGQTVDIRATC